MSDQKIYVPGTAKEIPTQFGGIIKLNMPVEDLKKLIDEHQQNGWITFSISKRKTPGEKGQTHSAWVDKWQPSERGARKQDSKQQSTTPPETDGPPPF